MESEYVTNDFIKQEPEDYVEDPDSDNQCDLQEDLEDESETEINPEANQTGNIKTEMDDNHREEENDCETCNYEALEEHETMNDDNEEGEALIYDENIPCNEEQRLPETNFNSDVAVGISAEAGAISAEAGPAEDTPKQIHRFSYPTSFKLEVVAYGEAHGQPAAARYYGIHRKQVRDWSKAKEKLKLLDPALLRNKGGGRSYDKEIDEALLSWIESRSDRNLDTSGSMIKNEALRLHFLKGHYDFKASGGWLRNFRKRNRLDNKGKIFVPQRNLQSATKTQNDSGISNNIITENFTLGSSGNKESGESMNSKSPCAQADTNMETKEKNGDNELQQQENHNVDPEGQNINDENSININNMPSSSVDPKAMLGFQGIAPRLATDTAQSLYKPFPNSIINFPSDSMVLHTEPKQSTRKFSNVFKLQVVNYAETYGLLTAARHFDINSKQVKKWITAKDTLGQLDPALMKVQDENQPIDAELDKALYHWILSRGNQKTSADMLKMEALKLHQLKGNYTFRASVGWLLKFKKRYNLVYDIQKETFEIATYTEPCETETDNISESSNDKEQQYLEQQDMDLSDEGETEEMGEAVTDSSVTEGATQGCGTSDASSLMMSGINLLSTLAGQLHPATILPPKPKQTHRSYNTAFKLQVVAHAENASLRSTAKHFGIHEKQVREWIKDKEKLEQLEPSLVRAKGAGRPYDKDIDRELYEWMEERRSRNLQTSNLMLKMEALRLHRLKGNLDFKASCGWLLRFKKRNNLISDRRDGKIKVNFDVHSKPPATVTSVGAPAAPDNVENCSVNKSPSENNSYNWGYPFNFYQQTNLPNAQTTTPNEVIPKVSCTSSSDATSSYFLVYSSSGSLPVTNSCMSQATVSSTLSLSTSEPSPHTESNTQSVDPGKTTICTVSDTVTSSSSSGSLRFTYSLNKESMNYTLSSEGKTESPPNLEVTKTSTFTPSEYPHSTAQMLPSMSSMINITNNIDTSMEALKFKLSGPRQAISMENLSPAQTDGTSKLPGFHALTSVQNQERNNISKESPEVTLPTSTTVGNRNPELRKLISAPSVPQTQASSSTPAGDASKPPRTRKSYDDFFKLQVVTYAEMTSNRQAARQYNVPRKNVQTWRKYKDKIQTH